MMTFSIPFCSKVYFVWYWNYLGFFQLAFAW
jgi:hypothetical protein